MVAVAGVGMQLGEGYGCQMRFLLRNPEQTRLEAGFHLGDTAGSGDQLPINQVEGLALENFRAAKAMGKPIKSMWTAIGHGAKAGGHGFVCKAERGSTTEFIP